MRWQFYLSDWGSYRQLIFPVMGSYAKTNTLKWQMDEYSRNREGMLTSKEAFTQRSFTSKKINYSGSTAQVIITCLSFSKLERPNYISKRLIQKLSPSISLWIKYWCSSKWGIDMTCLRQFSGPKPVTLLISVTLGKLLCYSLSVFSLVRRKKRF